MLRTNTMLALGIILGVLVLLGIVGMLPAHAAEDDAYVCAEDIIGSETASEKKTATKTYSTSDTKDTKDALAQAKTKPQTSEDVEMGGKEIKITSTCGEKDRLGQICFFALGNEESKYCFPKKKDGSIDGDESLENLQDEIRKTTQKQLDDLLGAKAGADKKAISQMVGELRRGDFSRFDDLINNVCDSTYPGRYNENCKSGVRSELQNSAAKDPNEVARQLEALAKGDDGPLKEVFTKNKLNVTPADLDNLKGKISTLAGTREVEVAQNALCTNIKNFSLECRGNNVVPISTFTDPRTTAAIPPPGAQQRPRGRVVVAPKVTEAFERVTGLTKEQMKAMAARAGVPSKYVNNLVEGAAGLSNLEARLDPNARPCSRITGRCLSSASGLFQFLKGTSERMGIPHSEQRNPQVATESFFRLAADNYRKIPHEIDAAVARGMDPVVAFYAAHNQGAGAGGARDFLRAYVQNPNQLVRNALPPSTTRNNPSLYGRYGNLTVAQSVERMAAAMSGDKPGSTFAGNQYYTNTTQQPFSSSPFSFASGGLGGLVNQLSSLFGGGSGGTTQQTAQAQPPVRPPAQSASTERPVEQPVLNFEVSPKEVQKGDSLQVIWATVGVSASRQCQLRMESDITSGVLEEANEGSRVVPVPPTTTVSELRFELVCTPRDTRVPPEDARKEEVVRIIN